MALINLMSISLILTQKILQYSTYVILSHPKSYKLKSKSVVKNRFKALDKEGTIIIIAAIKNLKN